MLTLVGSVVSIQECRLQTFGSARDPVNAEHISHAISSSRSDKPHRPEQLPRATIFTMSDLEGARIFSAILDKSRKEQGSSGMGGKFPVADSKPSS
jgi:hypothetical protein